MGLTEMTLALRFYNMGLHRPVNSRGTYGGVSLVSVQLERRFMITGESFKLAYPLSGESARGKGSGVSVFMNLQEGVASPEK